MTTPAHILSASLIALKVNNIQVDQLNYIYFALVSSGILDLDHIYFFIRDRAFFKQKGFKGQLHHARSFLHELIGVVLLSCISLIIFCFDSKLASIFFITILVHLSQDFFTGISKPFSPFNKTEIKLFDYTYKSKLIINLLTIIIFSILWLLYLKGKL